MIMYQHKVKMCERWIMQTGTKMKKNIYKNLLYLIMLLQAGAP